MLKKLIFLFLVVSTLITCRRDNDPFAEPSDDPSITLAFSTGEVMFDTVFTTVGSTTRWLRVYNTSDKAIEISSIRISGDNSAFFRMNVDGEATDNATNVYLAAKDSLYIFIDVTIDPSNEQLPFLVEGSLQFVTNGNFQEVKLTAYGQQAFFITPNVNREGLPPYRIIMDSNTTDTTWNNELPIVIYGYAVIDSDQKLTIEKGTQIYFHANSGLWVFRDGQIEVNGTLEEPVVFQGDRLDAYKDISGSWDRIWINDGQNGKDNTFNYAIIKNSFIGIQAEYDPFLGNKTGMYPANQLNLNNTIIENSKFAGILATNFRVLGNNLLVSNAGNSNLLVSGGGAYQFNNCTFANYYRQDIRNSPAVFLSHLFFDFEERAFRADSMVIDFNNCIIYGDQENEFGLEDEVDPGQRINFTMRSVLFKSDIDDEKYGTYQDTIRNPENTTIFVSPYSDDFKLASGSPALEAGNSALLIPGITDTDIEGNTRSSTPDLGCYEQQ